MSLSFPASPTDGQAHLAPNDVTYVYSLARSRWVAKTGATVSGSEIIDGTINTVDLSPGSVTLAKLAADVAAEMATYLKRDGSRSLSGPLDAGGQKVTNLATATANGDAVRLDQLNATQGQVNTLTTSVTALQATDLINLRKDGSVVMTGDLPMGGTHSVVGLRAASAAGEAVRYDEFSPVQALASANAGTIATLNSGKVSKSGDTMAGALHLPAGNPLAGTEATHKSYVDAMDAAVQLLVTNETNRATSAEATLMPRTGGTFFGHVELFADPTIALHPATKQYVDAAIVAAGSGDVKSDGSVAFTANLPMGGNKITGLAAATANGDAVRYEQWQEGPLVSSGAETRMNWTYLSKPVFGQVFGFAGATAGTPVALGSIAGITTLVGVSGHVSNGTDVYPIGAAGAAFGSSTAIKLNGTALTIDTGVAGIDRGEVLVEYVK